LHTVLGAKYGAKSVPSFWQKNTEIFGQKFTANQNFFFLKKIYFFLLTYIQPFMAHLKITFWNYFFDRVSPLLASKGSKKHLLGHISSFECCNFAKKYFGVSLAHIEFFYYGCTVVRWREMYVFFENYLFDPGIGYYTPQISLKKCFFRLSRTQWSIFTIHSDPLGGNSQKWVSTVVLWAETAKKLALCR
jgi:hypothetical protein